MSNLKLALENTMERQIAEYENGLEACEFSRRFEKRMNKLIKSMGGGAFVFSGRRIPLRKAVQLAFIIIILAALAVAAYAVISWSSFKVEEYDIYSLLNVTDISEAPLTLEEWYEIGADLSGYEAEILLDEYYMIDIYYSDLYNENKTFDFIQRTKDSVQSMRLDTEDALQKPTIIEVNGSIGLYVQYSNGAHIIFWDNGDYFIEIVASNEFGKNELISICNSVQKVEQEKFVKKSVPNLYLRLF